LFISLKLSGPRQARDGKNDRAFLLLASLLLS
jgi:hypothetical protein